MEPTEQVKGEHVEVGKGSLENPGRVSDGALSGRHRLSICVPAGATMGSEEGFTTRRIADSRNPPT